VPELGSTAVTVPVCNMLVAPNGTAAGDVSLQFMAPSTCCLQTTITQSELPITQSELPITQSELPITQSQLPITQSELPITQSQLPITQSELPITQSELPITQSELPITQSELPITQSELPITQSELPITQSELPCIPCPEMQCMRCRLSFGEAVSKAVVPGANITAIMATLDSKFRMVLAAFNNDDLYRQLFWTRLGYTPANVTSKGVSHAAGGNNPWRQQYTAGTCTAGEHGVARVIGTRHTALGLQSSGLAAAVLRP
jgi:hypothetical protein